MKRMRKIITRVVLFLCIVVIVINIPIITLNKIESDTDYSSWMSETLNEEDSVLDIAMLGAHDAFSNEIDIMSEVDPYNDNSIFEGSVGIALKGFLVKQSVTQTATVTELLESGVRYLDVRLSYSEDKWYTKHNYLSGDFEPIANNISKFLNENEGEFIILDFQHVNGVSYDDVDDYNTFKKMLDDFNLLSYAYIVDDLSTLTYGDVTNNGAESKILIVAPFIDAESRVLNYDDSIRSMWPNSDDFPYILEFLEQESENVVNDMDKFRVMQAVVTMQNSPEGILGSLKQWSLVNRADAFNTYLFYSEDFDELLETLPIVMVDHSDSNKSNFNEDIMELIIEFNTK